MADEQEQDKLGQRDPMFRMEAKAQATHLKDLGYEQVWTKCPKCNGEPTKYFMVNGFSNCPTCNGTGEKKLDSPELREKIFDIVTDPPCRQGYKYCEFWDKVGHYCYLKNIHQDTKKCVLVDQIIALIEPLIKDAEQRGIDTAITAYESTCESLLVEAREQERERIWVWGNEGCNNNEHSGYGLCQKRRHCIECWQALKRD